MRDEALMRQPPAKYLDSVTALSREQQHQVSLQEKNQGKEEEEEGEGGFRCEQCGDILRTARGRAHHILLKHTLPSAKKVCIICGATKTVSWYRVLGTAIATATGTASGSSNSAMIAYRCHSCYYALQSELSRTRMEEAQLMTRMDDARCTCPTCKLLRRN